MRSYFAMGSGKYDTEYGKRHWLHINNLGYYLNLTENLSIRRAEGRKDYHLLYTAEGEIAAGGQILHSGDWVLFLPDEPQEYTYRAGDGSLYYWIHFTGSQIPAILTDAGIQSGCHTGNGRKNEADNLLQRLSDTRIAEESFCIPYAAALLYALLRLLALPPVQSYPFTHAKRLLEESELSVSQIAEIHKMSCAHFIRSFHASCGISPAAYRMSGRIGQAKNLLADTELSVGAIAQQCGFTDALYFSRIFRKHSGLSPSRYRAQLRMPSEK